MNKGYTIACCLATLVVLLALSNMATAVNPGLKTVISRVSLETLDQVGVALLTKVVSTTTIPDISGTASTPVGSVDYSLSKIQLQKFAVVSSQLSFVAGQGLQGTITGSAAAVANWSYRRNSWPHVSGSGSVDVSISDLSIQLQVNVAASASGQVSVSTQNVAISIGKLDVTFHGGESWLYNLFDSYIEGKVKSVLQSKLSAAIPAEIDSVVNAKLATVPTHITVLDDLLLLDVGLTASPTVTQDFISVPVKAEVQYAGNPQEAPFDVPVMPDSTSYDMANMLISDYVFESATFAALQAGKLAVTVLPADIPSWFPLQFNTSKFQSLVPNLYASYPNDLMQMDIVVVKPPVFVITTSNGILVQAACNVSVNVETNNGVVNAFVLGLDLAINATVRVENASVVPSFSLASMDMTLQSTNIGQFSVAALDNMMTIMIGKMVLPVMDSKLAQKPIQIPIVDGVGMVSPYVTYADHYVVVSTNFTISA